MAKSIGNKREHLKRAQTLIAAGEPVDLMYAALELRLCLETMTYEKVRSFAKFLPKKFIERVWQPPQLLKAMLQFDPLADKSFELHVALEDTPGVPAPPEKMRLVGRHKAFEFPWLQKQYNRLGSFLHVPYGNKAVDYKKLASDLSAIAADIA